MPHKKSAKKRLRQTAKRTLRNRGIKSRVATAVKRALAAAPAEREAAVRTAVSIVDKAAKAGAIKRKTASRRKSRIMRAARAA